jgi:hypothetical protein
VSGRLAAAEAPATQALLALAIDADISLGPRFNGEARYKVRYTPFTVRIYQWSEVKFDKDGRYITRYHVAVSESACACEASGRGR